MSESTTPIATPLETPNRRLKSFITISKLVNELNTSGATHIRVLFNDFMKGMSKYASQYDINILDVRLLKKEQSSEQGSGQIIKRVNFKDILNIAGLNPWLNVGRQLNKILGSHEILTKSIDAIDIDLTPTSFMNNKGEIIKYHKIEFIKVKKGDANTRLMNNLIKETEEAMITWFNDKWGNKSGEGENETDETEDEIDVENL